VEAEVHSCVAGAEGGDSALPMNLTGNKPLCYRRGGGGSTRVLDDQAKLLGQCLAQYVQRQI
jgi:hypothetical protein